MMVMMIFRYVFLITGLFQKKLAMEFSEVIFICTSVNVMRCSCSLAGLEHCTGVDNLTKDLCLIKKLPLLLKPNPICAAKCVIKTEPAQAART